MKHRDVDGWAEPGSPDHWTNRWCSLMLDRSPKGLRRGIFAISMAAGALCASAVNCDASWTSWLVSVSYTAQLRATSYSQLKFLYVNQRVSFDLRAK